MDVAWDIVLRVLVAVACGGAIGLERERKDRPAGFRTHILVATGACLFTALSVLAFGNDTARVAAQVVTGIGFIGAGVIIIHTGGIVVGLTTAATLWSSAAVGMALGVGYFKVGLIVTGIILMVLEVFDRLGALMVSRVRKKRVLMHVGGRHLAEGLGSIEEILTRCRCRWDMVGLSRYSAGDRFEGTFQVSLASRVDLGELTSEILRVPGVEELTWRE